MTLHPRKPTYNKTVCLSEALHQRWLAFATETGQSFNGVVLAWLDEMLPHDEARDDHQH
jgi:hypothetical protein